MAVDTTDVDKQITDLTTQIQAAQAAVDNDPFTASLNNHQSLSRALSDLNSQLADLQVQRSSLIDLDSKITELSGQLTTLQTQISVKTQQLGVSQQNQVTA